MPEPASLRRARERAGLSQAALAERAGVSRPLVAAVERGRHRPGIDAALALAAALGTTAEALFAPAPASAFASVLDRPVPDGHGVVAATVGGRTVFAAAEDEMGPSECWPAPDAVVAGGRLRSLPGGGGEGAVVVGCDPALGLAAALLPRAGERRVLAVLGSTRTALGALRDGRCHAGLVHGPAGGLPVAPAGVLRVHLARWRVGVAARAGRRRASLEALCARGAAVVQRDGGASSQQALLRAVRRLGAEPPRGPLAAGHLDAARRVAVGAAPGAVTMEPAALALGLAFEPLEEHAAELWVAEPWDGHPGVRGLTGLLGSPALRRRLDVIGGYDTSGCGEAR
jgi:DNA-binding XRE family transcriptional regulator